MEETFDAVLFDLYGTLVTQHGQAIAGARDLLVRLKSARWAIVTSCPRRLADALVAQAQIALPDVLVCAEDVQRNKPAPDGYLLAAARLAAEPARCLVLEDSGPGIAAALAAGMTVINVTQKALCELALEVAPQGQVRLRR